MLQATKTFDIKEGQEHKTLLLIHCTEMIAVFHRAFSQPQLTFVNWPPLQIRPDSTKRWPSDKSIIVVKMPCKIIFVQTTGWFMQRQSQIYIYVGGTSRSQLLTLLAIVYNNYYVACP